MKWTNSYRSFGLKTKRSTGLKTIEHKQSAQAAQDRALDEPPLHRRAGPAQGRPEAAACAAAGRPSPPDRRRGAGGGPGLVGRGFEAGRPDRLHVAGIACVRMANGRFGCTAPGRRRARPRVYVIK